MDSSANTASTTARPRTGAQGRARTAVLGLALFGAAVGALACLRLGAVVLSTPPATWLPELNALVQPRLDVDPAVRARAEAVGRYIDDPALLLATFPGCNPQPTPAATGGLSECLALIDKGLRQAPYSGELWLARASWLARAGRTEESFLEALRMSWRTAPKEGWIAGGRVVLALRFYPSLPADLKALVAGDLALVIEYDQFSGGLTTSYAADDSLRTIAQPALEGLPPTRLKKFIDLVRQKTHPPA